MGAKTKSKIEYFNEVQSWLTLQVINIFAIDLLQNVLFKLLKRRDAKIEMSPEFPSKPALTLNHSRRVSDASVAVAARSVKVPKQSIQANLLIQEQISSDSDELRHSVVCAFLTWRQLLLGIAVWNVLSLVTQSSWIIAFILRDPYIPAWQRWVGVGLDVTYALACWELFKRYLFRKDDEQQRSQLAISMSINCFNWMWAIYFIGETLLMRKGDERWEYAITISCLVFLVLNPITNFLALR